MSKTTRIVRRIYILLTGFLLLSYLGTGLIGYEINTPILWGLRLLSVPLAVWAGRLWEDKGFRILGVYFVLISIRVLFSENLALMETEGWISWCSGLWVFTACYGISHVMPQKELRRFLKIVAAAWTIGMAAYSCVGVYTAWTDKPIYGLKEAYYTLANREWTGWGMAYTGFYGNRLMLMIHATVSGQLTCMSALIAIIGAISSNRAWKRVLWLAGCFPMILAMALTDSRTALISFAAGTGSMVGITLLRAFRSRKKRSDGREGYPWYIWILCLSAVAVTSVIILLAELQIAPEFNRIKIQGLIPRAYAEGAGTISVSSRGFNFTESMFTGRVGLWRAVIQSFQEKPILLLIGTSKIGTMTRINEIVNYSFGHCHNMILELLTESGVPGMALVLMFIIFSVRCYVRKAQITEMPRWMAFVSAIMISLWVADMDECYVWLRHGILPMLPFQFVIYGILTRSEKDSQGVMSN